MRKFVLSKKSTPGDTKIPPTPVGREIQTIKTNNRTISLDSWDFCRRLGGKQMPPAPGGREIQTIKTNNRIISLDSGDTRRSLSKPREYNKN